MSWVAIILWILQNAPSLIALVRQLIDLIRKIPHADQHAYRQHLEKAIKTGDVGQVEKTLRQCVGAACPMDLHTDFEAK